MIDNDDSAGLLEQVSQAVVQQSPLNICGGNSKRGLGDIRSDEVRGAELSLLNHSGIIDYDPTELVVSVRAGTPLSELNQVLDEAGQMLPFEPPQLPGSTIGGVLACGLSGPRRPFSGSTRDYVLGTRVINGQAQDLSFGGKVMKNVAGYDVSRLQIGAWGTLGVLIDVSMKVLPKPELDITVQHSIVANELQSFAALMRRPLPLSGAMLINADRYVRLSGSRMAVESAARELGGARVANADELWASVRDHTHSFFASKLVADESLWRISVADHVPMLALEGDWLHEWAGGQRWLKTSQSATQIFTVVESMGGHAIRYAPATATGPAFQPLHGSMQRLQSRVRDSFDPQRLFNRGRFHPELDANGSPDAAKAS